MDYDTLLTEYNRLKKENARLRAENLCLREQLQQKGISTTNNITSTQLNITQACHALVAPNQRSRLISLLIEELYKLASNNTTRQWMTKILQYLAKGPEAEVRLPPEILLKERKFSFRTHEKIEAVLEQLGQVDYFDRV